MYHKKQDENGHDREIRPVGQDGRQRVQDQERSGRGGPLSIPVHDDCGIPMSR